MRRWSGLGSSLGIVIALAALVAACGRPQFSEAEKRTIGQPRRCSLIIRCIGWPMWMRKSSFDSLRM